jgi:hypothetical protein
MLVLVHLFNELEREGRKRTLFYQTHFDQYIYDIHFGLWYERCWFSARSHCVANPELFWTTILGPQWKCRYVTETVVVFLGIIHRPVFIYKMQRFGGRILSPSSDESLLSWAQSIELVRISGHQNPHKIGYINKSQHKLSVGVKTNIKNIKHLHTHTA